MGVVFLVGNDLTLFYPTADRLGAPCTRPSAVQAEPIFAAQQLLAAGRRERGREEERGSVVHRWSAVCLGVCYKPGTAVAVQENLESGHDARVK